MLFIKDFRRPAEVLSDCFPRIIQNIKKSKTLDLISTIIDKLWYKYVNLHVFVH